MVSGPLQSFVTPLCVHDLGQSTQSIACVWTPLTHTLLLSAAAPLSYSEFTPWPRVVLNPGFVRGVRKPTTATVSFYPHPSTTTGGIHVEDTRHRMYDIPHRS